MRHKPHLEYQTFCEPSEAEQTIRERYEAKLSKKQDHEIERELTLVGPHRDEIIFYLDDFELRKFGSKGSLRFFALALKLAQLLIFSEDLAVLRRCLRVDVFVDLHARRTRD